MDLDIDVDVEATTSPVREPACEPSQLQDYFDKLLPLVLGAEVSDLKNLLWSNDTTEKLERFINGPRINVIFFIKKKEGREKDEQAYSYTCTLEIVYNSNDVAFVAFIKHVPTLYGSRTIQEQIQHINLSGPTLSEFGLVGISPYEALYSYIHNVVAPYFDAYVMVKEPNASGKKHDNSIMGIPLTKKKITELELSLLHLQRNGEIPEISLNIHPVVQETVKKCKQEGKRVSIDMVDPALFSDSIFLNRLQGDVNDWIKEIKKVTLLARDPASGTAIQEINFWLCMEKALEEIDEQLKGDHVELTLSILRHAKRFQATVSFLADTGLKESMTKVHKYNQLMRDFPLNELLAAPDVNKVKESLIVIFGHLRKLRLSSYPINKALALVEAISRDLNDQLFKILGRRRLMYMDYEDFEKVMAGAEDVFRTWDEMIKEFTNIARDVSRKHSDKFIQIKINSAHNYLQERVAFVRNFRKQHEQLHQTIVRVMMQPKSTTRIVVDGEDKLVHQEETVNTSDVNSMEEVKLAYDSVKNIDVLDLSQDGTEIWIQAENTYNEHVSRVENQIIASLRDHLGTCKNANEMFHVFSKFNALFVRPKIRGAIQEYQTQLIESVKEDIKKLQDKFSQQYCKSEAYHMAQLRDLPAISGAMIWARQIERQLQAYMKRVEDVLGKGWELYAEGQKLQTDANNFRKKLDTRPIFETWQRDIVKGRELNISGRLFEIAKNRAQGNILQLGVNFDPQNVTLFKEVKNLLWLNHQVPHTISGFAKVVKRVYPFVISLMETVRTYTQTLQNIQKHPEIIMLLASYRHELQCMIAKGMNYEWRYFVETYDRHYRPHSALDSPENNHISFVRDFANQVSIFQDKVDALIDSYDDISRYIDDLKTCAYKDRKFQGNLDKIQKLIDRLNLESYSNLNAWVAQLDKRIETVLVNRLQQAIEAWTDEFMISGDETANSTESISRESVSISGKAVKKNKRRSTRNDSMDGERPTILKAEKPTLVVSTHEVRIRNQVIYLDPPIEDARANWYNQLHEWLAIVCGLPRLQSSRYDISQTRVTFTHKTYLNLLTQIPGNSLEKAYGVIETKLKEVSEYVNNVWFPFQSLWDLEANNVYALLGDDLLKWQQILTEIKKSKNTFDNSDTSRSFGLIEIDYQQAQNEVHTKYDSWQREVFNKFGTKIADSMKEFNASVSHARKDLENKFIESSNISESVGLITLVQELKRKISKWDQDVEIFRNGQKILERQRYQFPSDWIYIDNIENEWFALNQILKRKENAIQEQVDALRININAEDKVVESEIKIFVDELRYTQRDIKPDIATNTLNIYESRVTCLKEKYDKICHAKEFLNMEPASENSLDPVIAELQDLKDVWSSLSEVWKAINGLKNQSWASVVPHEIEQQLYNLLNSTKKMPIRMHSYYVFDYVQDTIKQYIKVNPVLSELKSETLKEHHWKQLKQLFESLHNEGHVILSEMTLGTIWDMDLTKNELVIREIVIQAFSEEYLDLFNAQEKGKGLKEDKEDVEKYLAVLAKNKIAEIHKEVIKLYETAQYNKNITKILMERIATANSALQNDDLASKDYTSLRRFVQDLQDMKKYIEEITQYNAMQKFLESETIETNFNNLRKKYDTSTNLLKFVDFKKFNIQEEDKGLKEDIEKYQAFLAKNTIAEILNKVTELYEIAQHNKNITKILKKRIAAANSALRNYDLTDLASKDYTRLVQDLQDMKKYIEEITQYNTVQKFLEAKTIEKVFNDLREKYDASIILLKFVNFEKFNVQVEDKDLKCDIENLLKFQAVVNTIAETLNEVTELYKMAQHNKNITKILMERIDAANSALQVASKDYTSLQELVQNFQEMKTYIVEITQYNTVQKLLEAKTIEKTFNSLRKKYDTSISLLKFVDFKNFNVQEEDKILKDDIDKLLRFQAVLAESMADTNMDPIYFELFVPLIKDVADILSNVTDLYCTAEHNKQIARMLIERIATSNSAVSIYMLQEDYLYTLKDYTNLQGLVQVLQDMKKYIKEITQHNAESESIKKNFKNLCKEYDTSISLLNFVDLKKFNAQEEDKILKEALKFQANDVKQKVTTSENDKMNLVAEQVSEMAIFMQSIIDDKKGSSQNKIDESLLSFEHYKDALDELRGDSLRKYVHLKTKEEFAFKTIDEGYINQVKNQVTILKKLSYCQNIIHFYGLTYDGNKYYLVTEWAENGNLREYISKNKNIEMKFRLRFAYDIAKGLNFLNAVKIVHQDIRSENIIITNRDVAKITNLNATRNECVRYSAPEMLIAEEDVEKGENKTKYNTKSEVYSFGILLWEIAECRIPYERLEDVKVKEVVINGYREKFTTVTSIPAKYQILVNKSVDKNPDFRPTFAEILIDLQDIFTPVREELLWIENAIKEKFIIYIEWKELTEISKVGSGHFGSVYKACWSRKDDYVVFKKLTNLNDIQGDDAYKHEIQMQSRAHTCENVIRFFGITQEPPNDNYCIVMEYADGGDLREYLANNFKSLDWNKKYQLAFDITNGVHYLHKGNILHRDLHAKNIVIQKGRAKITDFGYAKGVETQTKLHKGVFGMAPYVAPELLNLSQSHSKKTDIYSLGVLLWELSSGYPPFNENYDQMALIYNVINHGMREQNVPNTPPGYYNLYTACWNGNPEDRPIIEVVYNELKNMLPKNNEIINTIENEKDDIKDNEGSSTTLVDNTQSEYSESSGIIDFTK